MRKNITKFIARKDKYHHAFRRALEKEGWTITDDPFDFRVGGVDFEIDLGAEKIIGAEKEGQLIATEIKTFLEDSPVSAFHRATGQYDNYERGLRYYQPERVLYLAVPIAIFTTFFQRPFVQWTLIEKKIKIVVYHPAKETIIQWINY